MESTAGHVDKGDWPGIYDLSDEGIESVGMKERRLSAREGMMK